MNPLTRFSRPALILALLAAPLSLSAQSAVWKVTKDNATVYLGGTCHVLRPTDFPLPAEFDTAFAAAQQVFFETDLQKLQSAEMQQIVMTRGVFTDGVTTMDKVLSKDAWANVTGYANSVGLPVTQVARMKPWFFIVMITMLELQKAGVSMEGVDAHYAKRLAGSGKTSGELESFNEHVNFIVNMGAGHESEMLSNSLEELKELPALIGGMLTAWRAGDLAKLDELMLKDMRTKYPSIYQSLLVERNQNWRPKIEAMFKTPETELVLVGVAHLAGDQGLIAELKARGYQLEQIKAEPIAAAPAKATTAATEVAKKN